MLPNPLHVWMITFKAKAGPGSGLLLVLFLATGCAPQYKTYTNYFPPEDPKGTVCVQRCMEKRQTCRTACRIRSEACEKSARNEAGELLIAALERHDEALRQTRKERYRTRALIRAAQEDLDDCRRLLGKSESAATTPALHKECKRLQNALSDLTDRLDAMRDSRKPTLNHFLNTDHCSMDKCPCIGDYDHCFQMCGGRIARETHCVAHCSR